jgi:hypothetical protein
MTELEVDLSIDRRTVFFKKENILSPISTSFELHHVRNHVARIPVSLQCHRSKVHTELNEWFGMNVHILESQHGPLIENAVQVHEAYVRLHDWKGRYTGSDPLNISGFFTLFVATSDEFNDIVIGMRESLLRLFRAENAPLTVSTAFLPVRPHGEILVRNIDSVQKAAGSRFSPWESSRFNPPIENRARKSNRIAGEKSIWFIPLLFVVISLFLAYIISVSY